MTWFAHRRWSKVKAAAPECAFTVIVGGRDAFTARIIRAFRDGPEADRIAPNRRAPTAILYDWREVYSAWSAVYS